MKGLSMQIMLYLDAQIDDIDYEPSGTDGNIFDNVLPSSPDLAVMVENTGGFPRDMRNTKYYSPTIRILVRGGRDPRPARELAQKIIDTIGVFGNDRFTEEYNFLQGSTYTSLMEGLWIVKCQAIQPTPINIGRDNQGRHRFSCNFELEVMEVGD